MSMSRVILNMLGRSESTADFLIFLSKKLAKSPAVTEDDVG